MTRILRRALAASLVAATLAGCVTPGGTSGSGSGGQSADFRMLERGSLDPAGIVIEEPGGFKLTGGQAFTPTFGIDCTKLSFAADGWRDAVDAGARKVLIRIPGRPQPYGGVLALCKVHKSATGPASRSYALIVPSDRIAAARDGLVSSVGEYVPVQRNPSLEALGGLGALLAPPPSAYGPSAQISQDNAWILWLSDKPATFGL